MSKVIAIVDIETPNGLLVACKGTEGVALHKHKATKSNYYKVAVRWQGRRKVYWCQPGALQFDASTPMDPSAYVSLPVSKVLNFPELPAPPDVFDYHFGVNLRQFRKDRKMSQHTLSGALSVTLSPVSQTTISYWERNREAPRGRYIQALSRALNVPAFLFFINFTDCIWLNEAGRYLKQLKDSLCKDASA